MGMMVIAMLMGVVLLAFGGVLNHVTLENEAYSMKRYLEYARDYAGTYQVKVMFQLTPSGYEILPEGGASIGHRLLPKSVVMLAKPFYFTPNLTPSTGVTLTLAVGPRSKKVVVDPSTGRIRIAP
ncbi:hypothetical protein [Candidatus Magnetaquicoccus inordinatus]|uniref:hypothetical protein n=1 Tax=Candidatus Magnetaquicoccus inordinatus TaxID=2496818 RepID=UPI00102BCC46|nr:hypothetical protein [Candidatus Magnetaquicoccus inordinatus]